MVIQQSALVREYLALIADKDTEIARLRREIGELRSALDALLDSNSVKSSDIVRNSGLIVSRSRD